MLNFPILHLLQDCQDPPLTPESLEELEIVLGFRFPADYAEFLLQFNGGYFQRDVKFDIPNPTTYVNRSRIDGFLGEPNDGIEDDGLTWWADTFEDRVPEDFLAIANCGGDTVLLRFVDSGPEVDGVWFWDHAACEDLDEPGFYRLADLFTGFLAMLRHDVTEEKESENLPAFLDVERGNLTAIERYLAQGSDPNLRNREGRTLLMAAVLYKWPQIARLLLERGADVRLRDEKGRTALHHAADHSVDCVKLLLAAGADAKARDNEGKGVLAEWSYRADQILRAHGAED